MIELKAPVIARMGEILHAEALVFLENLARDFAAGKADVSPKEFPFTCTHCQQRLLCRLDVAALTADDEETEAVDAE